MRVAAEIDGQQVWVEGEDVLGWRGLDPADPDARAASARTYAAAYVRAHPRPERDAQGAVNVPARQRMALLRRLAAGPASRAELLAAMRAGAGYVGASDWRNRMDELRGHGRRGGGHTPLPITHDEASDTYGMTASLPALSASQRDALALVKALLAAQGESLAAGRRALDDLLPDVEPAPPERLRAVLPPDRSREQFR